MDEVAYSLLTDDVAQIGLLQAIWRLCAEGVHYWAISAAEAFDPVRMHAHQVTLAQDNLGALSKSAFLLITTCRNEGFRLPAFLNHYRRLGFEHFVIVDNESTITCASLVKDAPDVTVYSAHGSFKAARFGIPWVNSILGRHANGKWVIHVDPDEYLVYPGCDTVPIRDYAAQLKRAGMRGLPVIMLDMYSDRPVTENKVRPGQDPLEVCPYFDGNTYVEVRENPLSVKHIRGGPRLRLFPDGTKGPMLNKTPLLFWSQPVAYARCANEVWPPYLAGRTYEHAAAWLAHCCTSNSSLSSSTRWKKKSCARKTAMNMAATFPRSTACRAYPS